MQGTIQRWGNSQGVRISKFVLNMAHMQENDPVEIVPEKGCILIRKVNRYRNLNGIMVKMSAWRYGKDERLYSNAGRYYYSKFRSANGA